MFRENRAVDVRCLRVVRCRDLRKEQFKPSVVIELQCSEFLEAPGHDRHPTKQRESSFSEHKQETVRAMPYSDSLMTHAS